MKKSSSVLIASLIAAAALVACGKKEDAAPAVVPEPARPAEAKPAAEKTLKIPYPEWLFPVDEETQRAAKRPLHRLHPLLLRLRLPLLLRLRRSPTLEARRVSEGSTPTVLSPSIQTPPPRSCSRNPL